MKNKIILAIESSCDDTAAAVYCDSTELSSIVHSQIEIHNQFGGVVPEIASRNHTMALPTVVEQALLKANLTLKDIDYIACTYGAGLQGALLAGLSYSKALAYSLHIPFLPINHIQAHIAVNFLHISPPFLSLVVSGGHTSVVYVKDYDQFEILDSTTDDAVGECFDKVARVLNLGYPGGPVIQKHTELGVPNINFFKNADPSHMHLSFSGLKTAVINFIRQQNPAELETKLNDICASFSKIAIDILVNNTIKLAKVHETKHIALAGGVAANTLLRETLGAKANEMGITLVVPPFRYCTDNAAMIALCAYYQYVMTDKVAGVNQFLDLNANSGLSIEKILNSQFSILN